MQDQRIVVRGEREPPSFASDYFAALDDERMRERYVDPPREVSQAEWLEWLQRAGHADVAQLEERAPLDGEARDLSGGYVVSQLATSECWREAWRPSLAERFSDYTLWNQDQSPPGLSPEARSAWVRLWDAAGCGRRPAWTEPWWVEALRSQAEVALTPPEVLVQLTADLDACGVLELGGPGSGPWPWAEATDGQEEFPEEVLELVALVRLAAARRRWLLAFAWPS